MRPPAGRGEISSFSFPLLVFSSFILFVVDAVVLAVEVAVSEVAVSEAEAMEEGAEAEEGLVEEVAVT
ncbi:unnamed protein product, partial [Vitis vinifera]